MKSRKVLLLTAAGVLATNAGALAAQEAGRVSVDQLNTLIENREPEVRVGKVDQDRLVVRRIDVVDENGTIRVSLAAPTPSPIIGGIQYKRAFPVSGLTLFDREGNERGGYGVADIEGTAAVLALDHANHDAIGWRVMPDGSVSFVINERAPLVHEPALDDRLIPGFGSASRIQLNVAANGIPAIDLTDAQDRPRLRLTVTEKGYGAIEFLDANGQVVQTLSPEQTGKQAK